MPRTARLLTPVTLAALLLAGCTPSTPMPAPPPTPDATPVFASDEEALAAAEEAYGKYLATVDAIFADGGLNPERLLDVASRAQYETELSGFKEMENGRLKGTGHATFELSLQSYRPTTGEVVVYSCDDISGTDIITADGTSVVSPERPTRIPYEVRFVGDPLIVDSRNVWDGSGVCE